MKRLHKILIILLTIAPLVKARLVNFRNNSDNNSTARLTATDLTKNKKYTMQPKAISPLMNIRPSDLLVVKHDRIPGTHYIQITKGSLPITINASTAMRLTGHNQRQRVKKHGKFIHHTSSYRTIQTASKHLTYPIKELEFVATTN
ncbi:hypothetical protein HOL34_02945 [bacterium]|jgi:hypothetical protein|nr:hypothetical protein [bacterium]MBT3903417.1 hypothetical protein [bacterium]MBT4577775.1 hypothetical protein [bacterium]MBT5345772.1 hypothetical protein [bacterium]MBT6130887.1 hypothetical protein [bacterium]